MDDPQFRVTGEPVGFACCQLAADFAGDVGGE